MKTRLGSTYREVSAEYQQSANQQTALSVPYTGTSTDAWGMIADAVQPATDTATHFGVSGFTSPTTAGASHTVTVTAEDASGATVISYLGIVAITSSDAQAVLPANAGLTNGVGSFTVTLKTAGSQSITATDTVTGTITGTQSGITVSPASASVLAVSGFPSSQTAGSAGSVTVTAKDAYGNTATGYLGIVHFTSTDGQAVLPVNYQFVSGDSGIHTFTNGVTLKTAGTESITATDTVTGTITGSQTGITVSAAAASKLSFVGAPSSLGAGVTSGAISVQLQDQYGNPVNAGSAVTVTLTPSGDWYSNSGGTTLISNNQVTIGSGSSSSSSFYFKSTVTGSVSLGGSAGSYTSASGSLTVTPGALASFSISVPASETAGSSFGGIVVTAYDAYGNIKTDYAGSVYFTSSDSAAVLPYTSSSKYTFTAGTGTNTFSGFTLKLLLLSTITVTDGTYPKTSSSITVSAAAASKLSFCGCAFFFGCWCDFWGDFGSVARSIWQRCQCWVDHYGYFVSEW